MADDSILAVARRLSREPSTICRENKRNSGPDGYRTSRADQFAWNRASRPKACKLVQYRALAQIVASKLQLQRSPQQIAGWLNKLNSIYNDVCGYPNTLIGMDHANKHREIR